jgi:putative copper export protein
MVRELRQVESAASEVVRIFSIVALIAAALIVLAGVYRRLS